MCGICGVYDYQRGAPVARELITRMAETIRHRGPDEEGVYLAGPVGLGHRRLSIIDLAAGQQPMTNEDGRLRIVFNGEIYNFPGLREELLRRGHRFTTTSDTEVILHQYEEDGFECVRKFRGMFAFALWDERQQLLFVARDRLGVKPLVYTVRDGRFSFASELAALLADERLPRELDPLALDEYLTCQYVPAPRTIYRGVHKLRPAHYLVIGKNGIERDEPYWSVSFARQEPLPEDQYVEQFRERFEESVRIRLISEVPLGAFLSGGLDSSATVAAMARLTREPVKTFSIGFSEKRYDETRYARMVAQRYHTDHHELTVKPDALEVLPKLVRHYGEPYADSSAVPTYYVAKMTRQYVTVALNGDAGDENFAGYERYLALKLARAANVIPAPLRRRLFGSLGKMLSTADERKGLPSKLRRFSLMMAEDDDFDRYLHLVRFFSPAEKAELYGGDLKQALAGANAEDYLRRQYALTDSPDAIERFLHLDLLTYLPEDLLVKVDIASMANSLECRSPFLDHTLVEFAASIPFAHKLRGVTGKYLLKRALRGTLPDPILDRAKMGFGVPVAEWFRGELRAFVQEQLLAPGNAASRYFEPAALQRLVTEHQSGFRDHGSRLWALLNFELWHRQFMK